MTKEFTTSQFGTLEFTDQGGDGFLLSTPDCPECRAGVVDGMWFDVAPRVEIGLECDCCHKSWEIVV